MTRQKSIKCFHFEHNERKAMIEMSVDRPDLFTFTSGMFVPVNQEDYSLRWVSKGQKQLRQYLYNYLTENGLPVNGYVLSVGAPANATKSKTFLDITITAPTLISGDLASNEAVCRTMLEKMTQLFNQENEEI